ncbi:MAG: 4Fe-4S cluster-binding domain-containing protein [Candidatus Altiarchaeota archaeon]|nr:4Fe-4S cluster-binding domain-containing protein [Candidatus Altiarchaeota archaeon]
MKKTKLGPVYGKLAQGCKLCGKGAKLVLFSTGKCDFNCFYCPISTKKKGKDHAFANERPIKSELDLLEEARAMQALGAGVTGGDPLLSDKTFELIKILKQNFSDKFHIHLYTRINKPSLLEKAYSAGVDEIRFHWSDPSPALEFDWSVGAEIPAIPGTKLNIQNYASSLDNMGVSFLNLNELEFSDTNWQALQAKGFSRKNETAAGANKSEEEALGILDWAKQQKLSLSIHYCSALTKTQVQLRERYKRTARNIAKDYEIITPDGTVLVGILTDGTETSPEKVKQIGQGKIIEYLPSFDKQIVEVTPAELFE